MQDAPDLQRVRHVTADVDVDRIARVYCVRQHVSVHVRKDCTQQRLRFVAVPASSECRTNRRRLWPRRRDHLKRRPRLDGLKLWRRLHEQNQYSEPHDGGQRATVVFYKYSPTAIERMEPLDWYRPGSEYHENPH